MKKSLLTAAVLATAFANCALATEWLPLPSTGYWQHLLHLGGNFVTDMLNDSAGMDGDPLFDNSHGPQSEQSPFPGLVYAFDPGNVFTPSNGDSLAWTALRNAADGAWDVWSTAEWPGGWQQYAYVKYWHVYIYLPGNAPRDVRAHFRHDDDIRAWNNGVLFFERGGWDNDGEWTYDTTLNPGLNSITIKLIQGTGGERMGVRLTDRDNDEMDDLLYGFSPENQPPVVTALAHNAVTLGECLLIDR